jgi:excinuclease ABC subunit A
VHNLQALDVDIPAGGLVCITGVSGSGKSTLVFDVLAPSAERGAPIGCREFTMGTRFRSIARIAQASAGGSPWSNAATHIGLFDDIRDLFAASDAARARGLGQKHFSARAPGGRCETCEGLGEVRIAMDFLPDVWTTCEDCGGKRYGNRVLECRIDGRSIADVLDMTVREAREFLRVAAAEPVRSTGAPHRGRVEARKSGGAKVAAIVRALDLLSDVGLGYVRLGQPARTLSGGERQRLVLATGLLRPHDGATLYLFDEPTTGLHADDVDQLLRVFDRLIDAGHTLVVIEHNLDVVAKADWVIDLGPEGGDGGGRLVAAGPPGVIAANPRSHTGGALRRSSEPPGS